MRIYTQIISTFQVVLIINLPQLLFQTQRFYLIFHFLFNEIKKSSNICIKC